MNKALIFKELKTVRFIGIILFSFVLLFKVFPMLVNIPVNEGTILKDKLSYGRAERISEIAQEYEISNEDREFTQNIIRKENVFTFINYLTKRAYEIFDIVIILLVLVMTFVQFFTERWGKNESISYSLPIKKGTIITHKLLLGFSIIAITFLINGLILLFLYHINSELLSPYIEYSDIIKWIVRTLLSYCAIYSLFMFVFTVCGNIFGASLISPLFMLYPFINIVLIEDFLNRIERKIPFRNPENYINILSESNIIKWVFVFLDSISLFIYSGKYNNSYFYTNRILQEVPIIESNWGINSLVVLSLTILFTLLSMYYFDKNKLEKRNWLIQFSRGESVFKILFALSFAMFSTIAIDMILVIGNNVSGYKEIVIYLTVAIVFLIIGFIISQKLLRIGRGKSKKPFKLNKGVENI